MIFLLVFNIILPVHLCSPIDKTTQNIFYKIKFSFPCPPIDVVSFYLIFFLVFSRSCAAGVICFSYTTQVKHRRILFLIQFHHHHKMRALFASQPLVRFLQRWTGQGLTQLSSKLISSELRFVIVPKWARASLNFQEISSKLATFWHFTSTCVFVVKFDETSRKPSLTTLSSR